MKIFYTFAAISGLIHLGFFALESIYWGEDWMNQIFQLNADFAAQATNLALNQGFYNLFLALGIFTGIGFKLKSHHEAGNAISGFALASMLGAGLVLSLSIPSMLRGAAIQGLPPLIALAALAMDLRSRKDKALDFKK